MVINKLHKLDTEDAVFISGNTPSSKNSKQWKYSAKKGRSLLVSSDTVSVYVKNTEYYYALNRKKFLKLIEGKPLPIDIEFTFIRATKGRFDYINIAQVVCDLMVKNRWIEDDDSRNIKPHFCDFMVDKENAGVIIKIL